MINQHISTSAVTMNRPALFPPPFAAPPHAGADAVTYTVKCKRQQCICDHIFGKSRSRFIIIALLKRGRNILLMFEKMSTSPKYHTHAT